MKQLLNMLKDTVDGWSAAKAPLLAAALAFASIFSLSPLLIIATAIAGLVFGTATAQEQIISQIEQMLGTTTAQSVAGFIQNSSKPAGNIIAIIIGIITMMLGASMIFDHTKSALNILWNVPSEHTKKGIVGVIVNKLLAFLMVLAAGGILLLSLVANAVLAAARAFIDQLNMMPNMLFAWQMIDFVVSLLIIGLLFAIVFRTLPDVAIKWRDVVPGAIVTSLLFNGGKYLIGWYLTQASITSTYGAAGSLVAVLLWIFYSAQIFLFGAKFTHVYTEYSTQTALTN